MPTLRFLTGPMPILSPANGVNCYSTGSGKGIPIFEMSVGFWS